MEPIDEAPRVRPRREVGMQVALGPLVERVQMAADEATRMHGTCRVRLMEMRENAVDMRTLPSNVLLTAVTNPNFRGVKVLPVVIVRLQFNKLGSMDGRVWRPKDEYLPKAVTMGVAFGKPYCFVQPIPGVTEEDWQKEYPPFHYARLSNENGRLCVGEEFRIGDATDVATVGPRLVELLSMVNMGDPMYRLSQAAMEWGGVWDAWNIGYAAIERGTPQDVFTEIPRLNFDRVLARGAVLSTDDDDTPSFTVTVDDDDDDHDDDYDDDEGEGDEE